MSFRIALVFIAIAMARGGAQVARRDTSVITIGVPRFAGGGTLVKQWSIGGANADEHHRFDQLSKVFVANDGVIWVIDHPWRNPPVPGATQRATRLRLYDSTGRFIREAAEPEGGSGAFGDMSQLPDGRVVMLGLSISNGRVVGSEYLSDPERGVEIYSASGVRESAWRFRNSGLPLGQGIVADASGRIWIPRRRGTAEVSTTGRPAEFFLRFRANGSFIDTVFAPVPPTNPERTIWAVHPVGFVVGASRSRYAIDLISDGPGPITSFRRTTQPVVITERERAELRALMDTGRARSARAASGAFVAGSSIPVGNLPTTKPPVSQIAVARDGDLWISVAAASERFEAEAARRLMGATTPPWAVVLPLPWWVAPPTYDVIEPTGAYVGQVRFPLDLNPILLSRTAVWAVDRTVDSGVLVKYAVVWK